MHCEQCCLHVFKTPHFACCCNKAKSEEDIESPVGQHRALIFAQQKSMLDIVERDLFRGEMREKGVQKWQLRSEKFMVCVWLLLLFVCLFVYLLNFFFFFNSKHFQLSSQASRFCDWTETLQCKIASKSQWISTTTLQSKCCSSPQILVGWAWRWQV